MTEVGTVGLAAVVIALGVGLIGAAGSMAGQDLQTGLLGLGAVILIIGVVFFILGLGGERGRGGGLRGR
jgi:hypothetical protein